MRIGIDLGGTKIEVIALDSGGTVLLRHRVPTPAGDYDAVLQAIVDLVGHAERETKRRGTIGVAMPGALSTRTGLAKNANSTALNGRAFDRDLAKQLGRPVRVENDANCFALSEATDGAGQHAAIVFGVILGTGVGGGIVVNGKVLKGRNAIAGEWGHNPLPWPAPDELAGTACFCGKLDCIETYLSGPGFAEDYRRRSGVVKSAHAVIDAAAAGDDTATATLDAYRDRLARALAGVVDIVDPDVIVLGGGLSNVAAIYEGLAERLSAFAFSDGVDTPVMRARHGDSSGVRGAAWLWPTEGDP